MIRQGLHCAKTVVRVVRSPGDAVLLLRMCAFIARIPGEVRRSRDVPAFFDRIGRERRPKARSFDSAFRRVIRMRDAALSMPALWRRDTCYIRAVTLYRFLDGGGRRVRVHFGVEQPLSAHERLRGHAWVSVDDDILEAPDAVRLARIHEVPLHAAF